MVPCWPAVRVAAPSAEEAMTWPESDGSGAIVTADEPEPIVAIGVFTFVFGT